MKHRELGRTGINISALAFGAGPIPALLTDDDEEQQVRVVEHALRRGVNWFDTAATYGGGQSERSLGRALKQIGWQDEYHLASKVRVMPDELHDIVGTVERSVHASLERLQVESLTLLQIHNSITPGRGDQPTSLSPSDVLCDMLPKLRALQDQGLVQHLGLTGIGEATSLGEVIDCGAFATMQVPYNLLNPSAGSEQGDEFSEVNYGNTIARCTAQEMGVLAIRVYAGGAVFGHPPSPHTYRTKFFPLDLYERDCRHARRLADQLDVSLGEAAIRFCFNHPSIASCIIGFSAVEHIDDALRAVAAGPLPVDAVATIAGSAPCAAAAILDQIAALQLACSCGDERRNVL